MRALSGGLTAAASSLTSVPDLTLELADVRPHFATITTATAGGPCAARIAPDGSLLVAYVTAALIPYPNGIVYVIRVTDPTNAGQWASWTAVEADGREEAGVCFIVSGSTVRLLWQASTSTHVRYVDSTNSGVSWSSPATLFDPSHALTGIAGDADLTTLFAAYDAVGLGYVRLAAWRSVASWAPSDWTNGDLNAISGLSATSTGVGTWLIAIAAQGVSGAAYEVVTCEYATTPAWSVLSTVQTVDIAAGLWLSYVQLTQWGGRYRLTWQIRDTGSTSGITYERVARSSSPDGGHWSAGLEDGATFPHGAAWVKHAAGEVLVAGEVVRLAPAYNAATMYRDCTADITDLRLIEHEGKPAQLTVTLDNSTGAYTGLALLRCNCQALLSQGYVGVGPVATHLLYLQRWTFLRAVDEASVTLFLEDRAVFLDRKTRFPLSYTSQTVQTIAADLAQRAGFEQTPSFDGSGQFAQTVPAFALKAGESYLLGLQRLLAIYSGAWLCRTVPGSGVAFAAVEALVLSTKSASQAAVWTYNGEPEHLAVATSGDRANHLTVFGPQKLPLATADAWDFADLASTGEERFGDLVEQQVSSASTAAVAVANALAAEQRLALQVDLTVGPHPGLELLDAVTANDGAIPTVTSRIIALTLDVKPPTATYELSISGEGL